MRAASPRPSREREGTSAREEGTPSRPEPQALSSETREEERGKAQSSGDSALIPLERPEEWVCVRACV